MDRTGRLRPQCALDTEPSPIVAALHRRIERGRQELTLRNDDGRARKVGVKRCAAWRPFIGTEIHARCHRAGQLRSQSRAFAGRRRLLALESRAWMRPAVGLSVCRSILLQVRSLAGSAPGRERQVYVRILPMILLVARADDQDLNAPRTVALEAMAIAFAGHESGTVTRLQGFLPVVRREHCFSFQHIDEFVLMRVPVALARPGARRKMEQLHARLRQSRRVTEAPPRAISAGFVERRRVARTRAPGRFSLVDLWDARLRVMSDQSATQIFRRSGKPDGGHPTAEPLPIPTERPPIS